MRHHERNREEWQPKKQFGWQKWFAIITAVIFLSLMFGGFMSLFIR
ncbi:MAG: hypothetical protein M1294_00810 [Firmicutes bacterium]|nr:hypothetical protein [Bacillota bacterium]MCL5014348.1 hypothetical protein [Bacillota bacterium]